MMTNMFQIKAFKLLSLRNSMFGLSVFSWDFSSGLVEDPLSLDLLNQRDFIILRKIPSAMLKTGAP